MLVLPRPLHRPVYYIALITELCKLQPSTTGPAVGKSIRKLYNYLADGLDALRVLYLIARAIDSQRSRTLERVDPIFPFARSKAEGDGRGGHGGEAWDGRRVESGDVADGRVGVARERVDSSRKTIGDW